MYIIVTYKCCLPSVLTITFTKSHTETHNKARSVYGSKIPQRKFYSDLHPCHLLRFVNPCCLKTSRKNGSLHGSYYVPLMFLLSFQQSLALFVRKDYRLENEFKMLRESSLGNMNKIKPKIKLSSFPLFQSCPLEYMLNKTRIHNRLGLCSFLIYSWPFLRPGFLADELEMLVNKWQSMILPLSDMDFKELKIISKLN